MRPNRFGESDPATPDSIPPAMHAQLYTMISICLTLGNVEFEDPDVGEGCIITTPETLELVAEMMQIAPEDLGQAITSKTMGGGVIEVGPFAPRSQDLAKSRLLPEL